MQFRLRDALGQRPMCCTYIYSILQLSAKITGQNSYSGYLLR